jgi:hypothetical protein
VIDVCKVNETTYKAIESKNVFTADTFGLYQACNEDTQLRSAEIKLLKRSQSN